MKIELTLGFSPCPNDTFIFDALVNQKIDTGRFIFKPVLEDVQTLNEWALNGRLDVTKISYAVLPKLLNEYVVLNSGGALGSGVGPLLITKNELPTSSTEAINDLTIAIPGEHTTANMLFSLAFPGTSKKSYMVFSQIEDAVLTGKVDAGVIIHENRFTYAGKGLKKIVDLGEFWEEKTGLPIPLGGIVSKRKFGNEVNLQVDQLIRTSIEYSFRNYPEISTYVKQHSQEMSIEVMRQHIDLYVNDYSLDLNESGRRAVTKFLEIDQVITGEPLNKSEVFLKSH